jgi:hypothetical protein
MATRDGLERFVFKAVSEHGLDKEEGVMDSFVANLRRILWRPTVLAVAGASAIVVSGEVGAQANQRLDSINVYGGVRAQGILQTPALTEVYYTSDAQGNAGPPLAGTHDLKSCQGTGPRGLYCLDVDGSASSVLRWANPDEVATATTEFTCANLGLTNCTSITVDLGGNVWVAGQRGTTYSLVKAVRTVGDAQVCVAAAADSNPAAWTKIAAGTYCYRDYASGRPRIYALSMIDGKAAGVFHGYGPGVLALEDPAPGIAMFYQDTAPTPPLSTNAPIVIYNKFGTSLQTGEVLRGLTLLQLPSANPVRNFAMVVSSDGDVLGYELGANKAFDTGFRLNSTTLAATEGPSCAAAATGGQFDLRASQRTRRTYFASGTCVAGYDPTFTTNKNLPVVFQTASKSFGLAADATLAGVAVSPGIEIDFVRDGCTGPPPGCTLIPDGTDNNTEVGASLAQIQLATSASGWVYYLVDGFLDCRYVATPRPAVCANGVINPDGSIDNLGTGNPTMQYLRVDLQMPDEIKQAFPGGLPPMLLQPDYAAPEPYTFGAIFGIPEEGLTYRDTFDGSFDIGDLIGKSFGCGGTQLPANSQVPPGPDIVVNISEQAPTVGAYGVLHPVNGPPSIGTSQWVSMLLNDACTNPTSLAGTRGSGFFYGLVLSPKFKNQAGTKWLWPDSAYALVLRSLFRDFTDHLYTYACQNLDAPAGSPAPWSETTCYQLQKDWPVVLDKGEKCVDASDQPKNSSGKEACSSFETQFEPFKLQVANAPLQFGAPDPWNRVGEAKARMIVLSYMYYEQFKKSLKQNGFVNPN